MSTLISERLIARPITTKFEADLKYEEENEGKEKVPVVKDPDPPYEYVDVSKLKCVTLDYATFKDAKNRKMFFGQ